MASKELKFYKVDKLYVDYLRTEETKARGVSYIPKLDYKFPQKEKFMCGIILSIGCFEYLAPVSSYKIQQPNNVLLYDDKKCATSSIRLNYMFPIDKKHYFFYDFEKEVEAKYKSVVRRELESANEQRETIRRTALKTYQTVKALKLQGQQFNWACDFELLENIAKKYLGI